MDSKIVVEMAKWIMAELVRVFHNVDTYKATEIVEGLIERTLPVVWNVEGRRRVLQAGFSYKDQALLLLYSTNSPVREVDLVSWVEHSNPSVFRRDVLRSAHRERLIEYDEDTRKVRISPTGIAYVEENLPLEI
jgi:hypothetical protein